MRNNRKGILFARYLWLYSEIVSKGPISFETISRDWTVSTLNETGNPLPHKTFENHRKAIEDMFSISIECNRATNLYYVEPTATLDFSRAAMDMLNGALLLNRVQTNPDMHRFIYIEPCGDESSILSTVVEALTEERDLILKYRHNYDVKLEKNYRVNPIAIKQFRRRWYLIAELEDGRSYSFPFDRILNIVKGGKVAPSKLNVDEMFADTFGIIREPLVKAEKIVLKVEKEQANYFLSRPLHASQKVIENSNEHVTLGLYLCPTYDFIMELLSHGKKVEVLEPLSLRQNIAGKISETLSLYS